MIRNFLNFKKKKNIPKLNYSMFSIKGFLILFINYKYKGELFKNIMIAYDKIESFFYYTSELILFLFVTSFGVNILFSLLKKKLIFF